MWHHLQQPLMKPTPQPQSYWPTCHSAHDKIMPTCSQIRNRNYADETKHCPSIKKGKCWIQEIIGWLLLVGWFIVFSPTCWKIWWLIGVWKRVRFQTRSLASFRAEALCTLCLFWGILGMLQKSWNPGTVLDCMLPIDFSQAYDTVPRQQL